MVLLLDHASVSTAVMRDATATHKENAMMATFKDLRVNVERGSKASKQVTRFAIGTKGYVGSIPVTKRCAGVYIYVSFKDYMMLHPGYHGMSKNNECIFEIKSKNRT